MTRPVIGVTAYVEPAKWGVWDARAVLVPETYVRMVHEAGGRAVVLPPLDEDSKDLVRRLDAVVLAGGADIDPARYGAAAHPRTVSRPDRDGGELAVLTSAIDADLPVLGVCRGMQVLNVALGGTLHQHIEGHNPAPGVFEHTDIEIVGDSLLHDVLGDATTVQCHHHQSLDRVADGLRVTAAAPDGTVEAVELEGAPFVVGVQSHPEQDTEDLRLFEALVEAARRRAS